MSEPTPTRADTFTSGLWTVGRRTQGPGAFEDFGPEAAGQRGCGFVRLSQFAVEHLIGAR